MARAPLAVYLYGRHVATIEDAGLGHTAIRYTPEAVANPAGCRLSLSLPVSTEPYPALGAGGRWVRSLLPEGRALAWAVQHFGIPEDDRFGLIAILGRDVAGAVEVLPDDADPRPPGRYEELSNDELVQIVERAHSAGLGLDRERGVRLSLAGMQDKVLLHESHGQFFRPIHGAPSTVILKPEPPERVDGLSLRGLASNELYCLALARRCGLRVPDARVERFGLTPSLVVKRFDREEAANGVQRIHQEDLLGALGGDPLLKYERPQVQRLAPGGGWEGTAAAAARPGPTLQDLAAVLSKHVGRANLLPFLEAVAFNVIIGNADAHARNYSVLLLSDGGVEMTPLYDLVCTRFWDELDPDLAQRVNGVEHIDSVTMTDLVSAAEGCGAPRRVATKRLTSLADKVREEHMRAIGDAVEVGGDPDVAERVAVYIRAQMDRVCVRMG